MSSLSALPLQHVFRPARRAPPGCPPPLLVLLHGTGADEHDLLDVGETLQDAAGEQLAVVSVRAPLRAQWGGYCWFEGYSSAPEQRALDSTVASSAATVLSFLQAAPSAFGTDPVRQVLLGFSQGATVGWTVATSRWPRGDLLLGSLLLSGRLFPEHAQPGTPLAAGAAPPAELAGRRVWATHGAADGTTPAPLAQQSLTTAKQLWGDEARFAQDVRFTLHRGGHEIPGAALQAAAEELQGWLA